MKSNAPVRQRPASGGYARGDQARNRIVVAALEVFGAGGFEAASTRAIAEKASVKLPALQYYFGGKEGLYLACAEFIAAALEVKLGPYVERVERMLEAGATQEEALRALQGLLAEVADTLVAGLEPENWIMFIMREQARPTAAFDVIYVRAIGRVAETCVTLTAHVLNRSRHDPEVRIRGFALLGQVLAFRAARSAALRMLDWPAFDGHRLDTLKRALADHTAAALSLRPFE
ncbi:CerR family C-terminal domain-containing protein [Mesorhizobium sp. C386A]|uniref:CerR family C-terminal domain-containing protein n=1 Tax=unclassified Mesorhizobium TaxID=325217 RepID=UPI0018DB931D|nr:MULTISPECIES: CerR family C-terminal domain-containing protein [unclassified Mesorhizobium]